MAETSSGKASNVLKRNMTIQKESFQGFDLPSVDSAPAAFARAREARLVPIFLLVFMLLCTLLVSYWQPLSASYQALMAKLGMRSEVLETFLAFRLRPFFLAFFVVFSFFAAGSWLRRLRLLAALSISFLLLMLTTDALFTLLKRLWPFPDLAVTLNLILGFGACALFAWIMLSLCRLPDDEVVAQERPTAHSYRWRLLGAVAASALAAFLLNHYFSAGLERLRNIGLLGGIGPGIILFVPILVGTLAIIEALSLRRRGGDIRFSVGFLVPAYNEAENIVACIQSLDAAAQRYGRVCKLYLVDNNSADLTRTLAESALQRCQALEGEVIFCAEPGKSKALNAGLARMKEDVVVRVDADTLVSAALLVRAIPYFADPEVGAVSGLPLPSDSRPLLSKMRAIEVYMNQGFARLGMSAVDAVLSLTGVFSAYRRSALVKLGGFAEAMNGEDTDIVLRISRLGYRLLNDPQVVVYSDVPVTLAALREQRLRWFRSTFHVASHNLSAIKERQGIRGVFSLPWALLQAVRRAMLVPLLIYGLLLWGLEPQALELRAGAALLAVIFGLTWLVNALVLVAYGRFDLLLYVPFYPLFRLLRGYLGLEMLFTLPLKGKEAPSTA